MNYTLRLLSHERFFAFNRWLNGIGDGNGEAGREATCILQIQHPDVPRPITVYAKFYPDLNGRSKALANEVTGYVLAHRFGLPLPPLSLIHISEPTRPY